MSAETTDRAAGATMERFQYDDKVVRAFVYATVTWALVAMLVGVVLAIELTGALHMLEARFPGLELDIPYITFGRLRPLHTNAAIFAFAGNAIFAAIYYSTQRLCKARMWSDTLSWLHFWGWQAIIVAAAITLPLGISQSREYAEMEWPIDVAIAVVWLGFFGGNFFMTLVKRRERHMYVALWFYIATIVTVTVLHVFNNLVVPAGWFKSYSIYAGVQDAFMQWWYGHNAVAFFLTTPFLGLMYYFVPKASGRPVFSYRLSIVHFWSLVFIYIWAGPHHLHYTALPEWASSLGMVFSLMLWMPSWGGMINGLMTLRGAWHKVTTDPILKFFVVGITFYGMATFEGPMMSIKSVNALTHYTDWTIAHVHGGALGWNGFMAFGMVYWLLPRLFQTELWSKKLSNLHFWLATIGILLYVIAIYVAGLTQGLMWRDIDETGRLVHPDFIETVVQLIPMYAIRVIGGLMYMTGAVLCFINVMMTMRKAPKTLEDPWAEAPALRPLAKDARFADEIVPDPLAGEGVLETGRKLARFATMVWHRRWERLPVFFTVMTVLAVLIASLFEIIPTFVIRTNVAQVPSGTIKPYTPLELYGRDIYIEEGCYNCHSQMIRPMLHETLRYGEYSKPQEFIYDHPFQWGSRRIGPDLAREGGRQSNHWHVKHFEKPPDLVTGSIMPSYPWLLEEKIAYGEIPKRVRVMVKLGVPYTDDEVANAEALARAQAAEILASINASEPGGEFLHYRGESAAATPVDDTRVLALIAYLQRMGTDINKPAEVATEPAATGDSDGGNL